MHASNPSTVTYSAAPARVQRTAKKGFAGHALRLLPGIALCALLAIVAMELGKIDWLSAHGLSALTVAIVLGIFVGNTVYARFAPQTGAGVNFSKQSLLRLGIILYGFRLTFMDIGHVGIAGVMVDAVVLTTTFVLTLFLGIKVFKLDRQTSILIGAGTSICGAAAIMATEPLVRAKAEQVTVAVSTVVIFGTVGIFLYPVLFDLNQKLGIIQGSASAFGIYAGSTIHEVAQVVAAARSISQETADVAVIAKMVRVIMLAPFLIVLSAYLAKDAGRGLTKNESNSQHSVSGNRLKIPWFAFIFIAMIGVNSLGIVPSTIIQPLVYLDTLLLAIAMSALGLTTHFSAVRRAGIKPLILAATLFVWLVAGGAFINKAILNVLG